MVGGVRTKFNLGFLFFDGLKSSISPEFVDVASWDCMAGVFCVGRT